MKKLYVVLAALLAISVVSVPAEAGFLSSILTKAKAVVSNPEVQKAVMTAGKAAMGAAKEGSKVTE